MATVAVSKNKRTQVLFRTSPPTQSKIIIAFDHSQSVEDSIFLAQIVDESLSVEVEDALNCELVGEVAVEIDDTDMNLEICR